MAWALVYTTSSVIHAAMVEGFLRSRGIDAITISAADSSRALTIGALAVVKIFVHSPDAGEAAKHLRHMEAQSVEFVGSDEDFDE